MWVPDVAEIGAENPEPGPCDSPQTKEEYDADAATGRALAEVFRRIQQAGEYFATREYAALLVRNAAGGVDVVRLEAGPGGGFGPPVDLDGLDASQIVGYFHTHPGGGPGTPSAADWADICTYIFNAGVAAGGDMSHLRFYVAWQDINYEDVKTFIAVYKGGDWGTQNPKYLVNPVGQPCQ